MKPKIYKRIPKGWKVLKGAITAPDGYVWIWNGKPRFSGEYRAGLVLIDKIKEVKT